MKPAFNIAFLGSTRGSNLSGVIAALRNSNITIKSVISNKADSGILDKAKSLGLPAIYIDGADADFENQLYQHLKGHDIHLLVLIGFMKILSPWFVARWKNKMINVHPSLLPKHAGLMNLKVHQAVLDSGEKETGCTVHWVTDEVDAGEIAIQKVCPVFITDTAESLKQRVQQLEIEALVEAIILLMSHRIFNQLV